MFRMDVLQNDRVRYANQPIAVVIADTLEAATEGAVLLAPALRDGACAHRPGFGRQLRAAGCRRRRCRPRIAMATSRPGWPQRRVRIEAVYETPAQYHNAMEPHAIVAAWDGDTLSIDTPSQGMAMAQARIAGLFGIAPENIHIRSPFLGGGFGSQGAGLGAADPRHHGRPPRRPPGQAGAAARADVRPGRPSRADPADAAPGRRRAMAADGARATTPRPPPARSTISSSRRPMPRHALYASPAISDVARGGAARHRHAAVHARARRGLRQRRAGKRDRRDGTGLRHGPAGVPAEELRRGRADDAASRSPPRRCASAIGKAPSGSAGPGARWRRGRCGTKPACWSAGAWARRLFPGDHVPGPGAGGAAAGWLGRGGDRRARHGPGRLDRAGPDRGRRAGPRP